MNRHSPYKCGILVVLGVLSGTPFLFSGRKALIHPSDEESGKTEGFDRGRQQELAIVKRRGVPSAGGWAMPIPTTVDQKSCGKILRLRLDLPLGELAAKPTERGFVALSVLALLGHLSHRERQGRRADLIEASP